MNGIVNKFLFVGDKFMPEMHLRQPRFTYSACGSFTKNKNRIQKFKETGFLVLNFDRLSDAIFWYSIFYNIIT